MGLSDRIFWLWLLNFAAVEFMCVVHPYLVVATSSHRMFCFVSLYLQLEVLLLHSAALELLDCD